MRSEQRIRQHGARWDVYATGTLDRGHLIELAVGRLGAIQVKDFLPRQAVSAAAAAARRLDMSPYSPELIFPRVDKSGIALFDYYDHGVISDKYWVDAECATAGRRACFAGSGDPLIPAMDVLRAAWAGPVEVATSRGRELFAGMKRQFSKGAKYHFDDINLEFPHTLDDVVLQQFGFNLFLEAPEEGGAVTVAHHKYHPRDERFRDGYGYADRVVAGDPVVTVRPEAGDGILFSTHNMHSVEPVTRGERITLSFFVGMTISNKLVLWS